MNVSSKTLGLALDVIAKCAFGIETNASKNPDHELVKAGNEVVRLMQVKYISDINQLILGKST